MGACCGPERAGAGEAEPRSPSSPQRHPAAGDPARPGSTGADPRVLERLSARAPGRLRMVGLTGGTFRMGSEDPLAYPEDGEGPVREIAVPGFAIAPTAVTVAEFAAFVLETGHRTDAEAHGGSFVFVGCLPPPVRRASAAVADAPWWREVAAASWFRPGGPGSSAAGRAGHPVTHVSRRDALAYADWVGARLPSEEEWEFASRGGLDQQPYPWGGVREPDGEPRMNTFPGEFPDRPDGPVGTVDAGAYAPNAYGLHNMTGNVWEWTSGRFGAGDPRPVLRGGSYMCHASYCRRYRTSARTASTADTSLGHTGFRLALSTG